MLDIIMFLIILFVIILMIIAMYQVSLTYFLCTENSFYERFQNRRIKKYHQTLLGKKYYKDIYKLRTICIHVNSESYYRLCNMVERFEQRPESYRIVLLKHEYAITLIKNMIEEAYDNDVNNDTDFNNKIEELIDYIHVDIQRVYDKEAHKEALLEKATVKGINEQIEAEIEMLEQLRALNKK